MPPAGSESTRSALGTDCTHLHPGIVYGPVTSRRFGRSLGINLLPPGQKACSFNCLYCQYGWTDPRPPEPSAWPAVQAVVAAVSDALAALRARGDTISRLTIAGHGEPTLHPAFAEIVDGLRALRDARAPGVPLGVLSNSTTAHQPEIRQALLLLDEREMKLDAGTQEDLRRVNASAHPLARIVESLSRLPHITLQSMFVRDSSGRIDNSTAAAVQAWASAVSQIRPDRVHIYTLARRPAWDQLVPVDAARLEEIARLVRSMGIDAQAYP